MIEYFSQNEKNMPKNLRKDAVTYFESALLDFFHKAGREHLSWRKTGVTAYEVWVSEIMLQQTQVSRVLFYYERFLERFPDVETLARASWEEFLPYYAGLGYYTRGRNMLRTAKMIVEKFDGEFPEDTRLLEKLPGIGSYTASAIASFAYGANTLAWDTNLRRVVGRFFFGTKQAEFPKLEKVGEKFSTRAKEMNAALMDFGSAICAGKPKCGACPLREQCVYFKEKGVSELKVKERELDERVRKRSWKEARAIVFLHENHKKYFSSAQKLYRPFFLPASHNTRAGIKCWFLERYGLAVAVRPPHKKMLMESVPTLLVNAQILSGTHAFEEFSREMIHVGKIFL